MAVHVSEFNCAKIIISPLNFCWRQWVLRPVVVLLMATCISAETLVATNNGKKAQLESLRLVHAIWRHGHRSPAVLIPSEPNAASAWPMGLGELTALGAQQEIDLGRVLRKRYDGFISTNYSSFEIYVRSSDFNRSLASAQAVLRGLYTESMATGVPIPIHSVPKNIDNVLYDLCPCAEAEREQERFFRKDSELQKLANDNEPLLRFVSEQGGFDKNPLPLMDLWMIHDPLVTRLQHNATHPWPQWVNASVKDAIWNITDQCKNKLFTTDLWKRLRGGTLFADIVKRMQQRQSNTLDKRLKLYGYSGHDTNIIALLSVFGINVDAFPPYASAVLVELHEENSEFFVKLFYKSEADSTMTIPLAIPWCSEKCPLTELVEARTHLMPSDWEQECGHKRWFDVSADAFMCK